MDIVWAGNSPGTLFFKICKTGDGILTAVQLLGALVQNNKRLSEMGAMMTKYPQILLNVRVADKHGWEEKESIKNIIKNIRKSLVTTARFWYGHLEPNL